MVPIPGGADFLAKPFAVAELPLLAVHPIG